MQSSRRHSLLYFLRCTYPLLLRACFPVREYRVCKWSLSWRMVSQALQLVCSPVTEEMLGILHHKWHIPGLNLSADWSSFAGDKEISILSGKCLRPNPHNSVVSSSHLIHKSLFNSYMYHTLAIYITLVLFSDSVWMWPVWLLACIAGLLCCCRNSFLFFSGSKWNTRI